MQLKQILEDDDAVSPVIGVILMVAITVILAAVIATFVLGLGEQVSSTAPQASFSFEYTSDGVDEATPTPDGILEVTHDGGDAVKGTELYIRGQNGTNGQSDNSWGSTWDTFVASATTTNCGCAADGTAAQIQGSQSGSIGTTSAVVAGDYLSFPVGSNGELSVIYQPQSGETSATLGTWEGPDAS